MWRPGALGLDRPGEPQRLRPAIPRGIGSQPCVFSVELIFKSVSHSQKVLVADATSRTKTSSADPVSAYRWWTIVSSIVRRSMREGRGGQV